MFKKQKLIGNLYMVTMMSLCVTLVHLVMAGNTETFFAEWGKGWLMALPFAVFFTTFIGTVIQKISSFGMKLKRVVVKNNAAEQN